jgi:acyl dehydratase
MLEPRFLEDLTVGELGASPQIAVSEAEIIEFAKRYDPQDMHLNAVYGLIASGWHTAALVMRLLMDSHPLGSTPLLGLGVEDLRWPTPVRPGDVIRAETEILSIVRSRSKPDYGIVRLKITARNQHGKVVYIATPSLWVPSRNA